MARYHYVECGLDNVIIDGVEFLVDDRGEKVVTITNINDLHRAIACSIVSQKSSMSGKELRFLRTEMGLTQAQIADLIHREPLTISRWERSEVPIDSNAEALIRLHAIEMLELPEEASVKELLSWCVESPGKKPIEIDGRDPTNYHPIAA